MIVKSLQVRNFLSIADETLHLDPLTVLVGANGSGKSAFLRALDLFFAGSPKVSTDDFHSKRAETDIEITLTFCDLSAEAAKTFAKYIDNGDFAVTRVFSQATPQVNGKYFGSTPQNPDFSDVRAGTNATERKTRYNELKKRPEYAGLPQISKGDDALAALEAWEEANPSACARERDSGQFLGYTGVGQGSLRRYLRFVLVPAVRDAAKEAEEGRASPITELLDLVVRSRLAAHEELEALKKATQEKLEEIVNPSESPQLDELGVALSGTLRRYASDTAVLLRWQKPDELALPSPKALVKLQEQGFECTVDGAGHGLQRALIVTLLQHLEMERHRKVTPKSKEPGDPEEEVAVTLNPDLLIAIEEPELYQHPSRQRQIADVLMQLAKGEIAGVARRTQVVYSTHSPLLLSLDRMDQIRRATRIAGETSVKKTVLSAASLDSVAARLWQLNGSQGPQWTAASLKPRLEVILNPWMNEGFFADLVVLVEGESDRAALLAQAGLEGVSLEAMGVSVIPCDSKSSLDRPCLIFGGLGIPTYLLWDNDRGGKEPNVETNRLLCRILGRAEEDYPAFVGADAACLDGNLEETLSRELGESYGSELEAKCKVCGLSVKDGRKKPSIVRAVLAESAKGKVQSASLRGIVAAVIARRQGAQQ